MGATQFEINYENALKNKNDMQGLYNKANKAYLDNKKFTNDAKAKWETCEVCMIGGVEFLYQPAKQSCTKLKTDVGSMDPQVAFNLAWKTQKVQLDCAKWRSDYNTAKTKDGGLKETVDQARNAYQEAEILANKAYEDWMEWKVSNMTPEELAEYEALAQSGKAFGLKLATWKWIGIGGGILAFAFGAFFILRRFKVKVPKINIPN